MINEELKNEYVALYSERNKNAADEMRRIFTKVEPFEKEWNKDVSCFTSTEIVSFYKAMFFVTIESLDIMNGFLKRYTRFMLERNMVPDGQNHYEEIDNQIMCQCLDAALIAMKVIGREDLLRITKDLRNAADRFILLAFFEGLSFDDIYELSMDNFSEKKIHVSRCGRQTFLDVSDELYENAKEAADTYEYYTYDVVGNDRLGDIRSFKATDKRIIKDKCNTSEIFVDDENYQRIMHQRLYNQLLRIRKNTNNSPVIGAKELRESGRVDMIRKYMKADQLPPEKAIRKYREAIEDRYGVFSNNSISKYLLKYGKYLEE